MMESTYDNQALNRCLEYINLVKIIKITVQSKV